MGVPVGLGEHEGVELLLELGASLHRSQRCGEQGLLPATMWLRACFRGPRARALLAGCAAHSILPLERPLTAAVGMIFALTGHGAESENGNGKEPRT